MNIQNKIAESNDTIKVIKAQMLVAQAQANWWMHCASNGHVHGQKIYQGVSETASGAALLSEAELRTTAMQKSLLFIDQMRKLSEALIEIKDQRISLREQLCRSETEYRRACTPG